MRRGKVRVTPEAGGSLSCLLRGTFGSEAVIHTLVTVEDLRGQL